MGTTPDNADPLNEADADDTAKVTELLDDLRRRAKLLLSELETFKARLKDIRLESAVETAHYHAQVRSELGMLERLPPVQTSYHVAKSSNLPFLETVWNTAKSHGRLSALQKRFFYSTGRAKDAQTPTKQLHPPRRRRRGRTDHDASCIVDAVLDGGRTWYKISLVSNTRLLFDLAKRGWEFGDSDSEGRSSSGSGSADDGDDDLLPVVKMARELAAASKATRVRTKHPRMVLILPRVTEGETKEIDKIINDCRSTGVQVICRPEYAPQTLVIEDALSNMAPSPFVSFTPELNIDCTILLALVSEFSHAKVSKEPWFHTALQRQVEIEDNENLLPSLLYPAMGSRSLVCTGEAAQRMWEIVDTIGTPSEKARTAIMMGKGESASRSGAELVSDMQAWSAYPVPTEWHLPIRVIKFDSENDPLVANLPPEAASVCAGMTSINRSIFRYGWAAGVTTISSNKTIVKQIESEFDKIDDVDDAAWPKIWLCPTARSLVGKENQRGAQKHTSADGGLSNEVQAKERKDGVGSLPDPLRRESQRRNGLDVLSLREGCEVEDLRPDGYDYSEVLQAKSDAAQYQ